MRKSFLTLLIGGLAFLAFFSPKVLGLSYGQVAPLTGQKSSIDDRSTGRLIKTQDEPAIYFVLSNYKMPFPSAKIFLSYGYNWNQVQILDKQVLDIYPEARYIKLIGNGSVYKLEGNIKRYVTQAAASALNLDPDAVMPVNKTEFNFYRNGNKFEEQEARATLKQNNQTSAEGAISAQGLECKPDPNVGGEDGCVYYNAVEKNDITICEQAKDEKWKALCIGSFAGDALDPLAGCNKLLKTESKDVCINGVAVQNKNSQLCVSIGSEENRLNCLAGVGIASKNLSACDNLEKSSTRYSKDSCVMTYAVLYQEKEVCEKISSPEFKNYCLNYFNQVLIMK